jgi:signal transduction histidine kinase
MLLTTIVHSIVEAIGDACVLRLLSDDQEWLETQAVYHTNPVHQTIIRDILAREPQRTDEGLNGLVIQTGKPMLLPVFPADLLRDSIKQEYLPYLEQVGIYSFMLVPLRVQGQVIGTLAISRDTPGHPYTNDDQIFVQELADRAALAIDNARLYRAAQDAVKARDQFVAIASHELRTPLTGILGYAEMLLRRAKRDTTMSERDQRALSAIAAQGQRLQKLVGDMLELSRIEMGMFAIERTPLNFNTLIEQLVVELEPTLHQHTLRILLPDAPLMLNGDSRRLEQVVANLLQNAVKYSPAGGQITVELTQEQNNARLVVADQGIGIPESAQGHLFQRFYRADNVGEHQISGFGIGLYLVKEIIERHDGTVTLQSYEEVGSTFIIRLPLSASSAGETSGEAASDTSAV